MERPRPVPAPTSFVVKNGSKMRCSSPAGIPGPVSHTNIHDVRLPRACNGNDATAPRLSCVVAATLESASLIASSACPAVTTVRRSTRALCNWSICARARSCGPRSRRSSKRSTYSSGFMAALLCPCAPAPGAPLTPATHEIVTHARLPAVCPVPWQGPRSSALPASDQAPGFHGCNDRAHLKRNIRPSEHFLRVFRSLSFTHACHWLAVLPGKDGTAALDCCVGHIACHFGPQELVGDETPSSGGYTVSRGGYDSIRPGEC